MGSPAYERAILAPTWQRRSQDSVRELCSDVVASLCRNGGKKRCSSFPTCRAGDGVIAGTHLTLGTDLAPRVRQTPHNVISLGHKTPAGDQDPHFGSCFPNMLQKYKFGWLLIVFYEKRKKFGGQLILEITRFDKVKQLLSIAVMCASSLCCFRSCLSREPLF